MERVARGFDTEPIQRGLARIPQRIRERLGHVDFLCGVDHVFVGLSTRTENHNGFSLVDGSAHISYPETQVSRPRSDRISTVVFPVCWGRFELDWSDAVVHELAHELDRLTSFGSWSYAEQGLDYVSEYARTDWYEAFAESFTAWLFPEFYPDAAGILRDSPVLALFEELAR